MSNINKTSTNNENSITEFTRFSYLVFLILKMDNMLNTCLFLLLLLSQ